jgi:hypothetical protein
MIGLSYSPAKGWPNALRVSGSAGKMSVSLMSVDPWFDDGNLNAAAGCKPIRNLKSEIRNKSKTQNPNVPNVADEAAWKRRHRSSCFEYFAFEFLVCFGFRASDF